MLESVTAPNKVKKWLKQYEPFKRMIYQGRGRKVRTLFDQTALPRKEKAIRNRINTAVSEANTGNSRSQVNFNFQLAHAAEVSYSESGFNWSLYDQRRDI